ncbi:MAG TPA: Rrf2 family transcriptional regulator [Bacteroidales bacterium]|nr:Rrf2 family transcriptional regulator [Bacteroidales bacterium]
MKISTRTRYGLRAMIEIAGAKPDSGVFQKDIAASQSLSVKYLDHIIQALKTARLISNAKGKKSGYILTRKPSEITIFDIHRAFEPGICVVECISGNYHCDLSEGCQASGFWKQLNNLIYNYFNSITLDDLIHGRVTFEDESFSGEASRQKA